MNIKNFSKSSRASPQAVREAAHTLAIDALLHIAADPDEMARFIAETGFDPGNLRRSAAEPAFASGVLDYLCAHESLLIAFAATQGVDPASIDAARQSLLGRPTGDD